MRRALKKDFFAKPAPEVARSLLGKFLVVQRGGSQDAYMITETEAYEGPNDKGSHAFRGVTPRTKVMFGEAGRFYTYFTYGIHWMLNVVTGETGYPSAVLIRGIEGYEGPAKLTKALGLDGRINRLPANRKTGVWFEDRGIFLEEGDIKKGPRIGIDYAGPFWAKRHYRFYIKRYQGNGNARRYLSYGRGRARRILSPQPEPRI